MLLMNMDTTSAQACIDVCLKCAQACNKCFKQCLEDTNINEKKEALALLVDCAEICYVTAVYMTRDNSFSPQLAASCAELCEKCANVCSTYEDLHCKASVEACRQCAEECRKLI
jgi:hypothetical protein